MELQEKLAGVFDITMDCEDGAKARPRERARADGRRRREERDRTPHKKAGVRIHDYSNQHWKQDVDILVRGAGEVLAYITIPKPTAASQARRADPLHPGGRQGGRREARDPDPRAARDARRDARRVRHRGAAVGAGARLRPDGLRVGLPRRRSGVEHALARPVRSPRRSRTPRRARSSAPRCAAASCRRTT